MGKRRIKTPYELHVEEEIRTLDKTAKMDKELAKYGRPVQAGMMWTASDLARFFLAQKKKRKR